MPQGSVVAFNDAASCEIFPWDGSDIDETEGADDNWGARAEGRCVKLPSLCISR